MNHARPQRPADSGRGDTRPSARALRERGGDGQPRVAGGGASRTGDPRSGSPSGRSGGEPSQEGGAPPALDAEDLPAFRRLAEAADLPAVCHHKGCRARGCRGPRATADAFPGLALPACLAATFDAAYAPVLRWDRFMGAVLDAAARAKAREEAPGPGGRARA